MQVKGYYNILKHSGVRLEEVLKWFFEEYLLQEFDAKGFRFNPPSESTTLVEKCRTIASEMDGVLNLNSILLILKYFSNNNQIAQKHIGNYLKL